MQMLRNFLKWALIAQVVGTVLFTLFGLSDVGNASGGAYDWNMITSVLVEAAFNALGMALFFGFAGVWRSYREMIRTHEE